MAGDPNLLSRTQDGPSMNPSRKYGCPGGTTMAIIRATCQDCGDVEMTTADVWVRICDDDRTGTYSFRCPECAMVVVKQAEPHIVELLVASGVTWSTWRLPEELHEARGGAPINHDDMLAFHELLDSDDWFTTLSQMVDED
jgi:hypothetical protein